MKNLFAAILVLFISVPALAQTKVVLPKNLSALMDANQKKEATALITSFKKKYAEENSYDSEVCLEFAVDTFAISRCEEMLIDKDSSTYGMVSAIDAASSDYDVLLNKYYQKLRSKLSAGKKAELTKAQKAWLAFRDADTAYAAATMPEGTMYRVVIASMYEERIKQRVIQLFDYLYEF